MNIIKVHNFYQHPGGEDTTFEAECSVLEAYGHRVTRFTLHNDAVDGMSKPELAARTLWNPASFDALSKLIAQERPEVVHFHNTVPLISPAGYYAVRRAGAAVVQTLHNYRLLCPGALFHRAGSPCEKCLGSAVAWAGIRHGCYRGSRAATAGVAGMVALHKALGTWRRQVDLYIAVSRFARDKFIEGGMPADRVVFKPEFVAEDPGVGTGTGGFALFVGRLTPEKGIRTVLDAWDGLGRDLPLKIAGSGPLADEVTARAAAAEGIEYVGWQTLEATYDLMGRASVLVFPSEWYETFGRVAVEAFAKGTPAIAANIGALTELIDPGQNGLLFQPGDVADLAEKVRWFADNPEAAAEMRGAARRSFEEKYTADRNYHLLMGLYERAMRGERAHQSA